MTNPLRAGLGLLGDLLVAGVHAKLADATRPPPPPTKPDAIETRLVDGRYVPILEPAP